MKKMIFLNLMVVEQILLQQVKTFKSINKHKPTVIARGPLLLNHRMKMAMK
jgi:hypothetical protein